MQRIAVTQQGLEPSTRQATTVRVATLSPSAGRAGNRYIVLGFLWGLTCNFSLAAGEDVAPLLQGAGLALALGLACLERGTVRPLLAWTRSEIGLLIAVHALAAIVSGLLSQSSPAAILRYVLLLPAVSLLLFVGSRGSDSVGGLRTGLLLAGIAFVVFHLYHLDVGSLFDPRYRLTVFINTNGVAFISAMTCVLLLAPSIARGRTVLAFRLLAVGMCSLLVFATKSRTGMLALVSGALVHLILRARSSRRTMWAALVSAGAALAILVAVPPTQRLVDGLANIYMLDDEYRSIESGTYRYEAWRYVISDLWLPNPLLGVGPGRHSSMVNSALDVPGAHNGVLANLADVGLLGTGPLLLVTLIALARAKRATSSSAALALLVAGMVESGAETMWFSMGNTGSLLFLVSVTVLGSKNRMLGGRR